jgi:hypothetical protein
MFAHYTSKNKFKQLDAKHGKFDSTHSALVCGRNTAIQSF